jgi:hypothetical protein
MDIILKAIRDGRTIDAIKEFRSRYGSGLKDAKDAVDAIRSALGISPPSSECIVVSRRSTFEEYLVSIFTTKQAAMSHAAELIDNRKELYVAQIIAKAESVTTRMLKATT